MEKLTRREEELMRCFWERGPLFVRELVAMAPEPKPHFNTLSTMVRALEAKGYVGHTAYGSTYQYYPLVSEAEFSRSTLGNVISRYFENSYLGAVSALVEEEKISVDELALSMSCLNPLWWPRHGYRPGYHAYSTSVHPTQPQQPVLL